MIASIQNINDANYLKAELFEVNQLGYKFFLAKIKAEHVFKIYTVKPLEYDIEVYKSLSKKYPDKDGYYNDLISRKNLSLHSDEFQRDESQDRIKEIRKFIQTDKFPLFPNTIIATCDLGNSFDSILDEESDQEDIQELIAENGEDTPLSYITREENRLYLYIPYKEKTVIVIDGQHRIKGLQAAGGGLVKDYELLFAFLIGYDRGKVAHQFYTINYHQKPVNKSLLYQLMGQFSDDLNRKTFLHGVVRMMNEIESSAFYERVKMLGLTDKTKSPDARKKMTVSQAFLIDYLLPTIGDSSPRGLYAPVFYWYYKNKDYRIEVGKLILKFFGALRRRFKDQWNTPDTSIISKTISVGAFIKVMQMVYVQLLVTEFNNDPTQLCKVEISRLEEVFDGVNSELFDSEDGPFGKQSSAGSLGKVREAVIENMTFFEGESLNDKIDIYKDHLSEYKEWFSQFVS